MRRGHGVAPRATLVDRQRPPAMVLETASIVYNSRMRMQASSSGRNISSTARWSASIALCPAMVAFSDGRATDVCAHGTQDLLRISGTARAFRWAAMPPAEAARGRSRSKSLLRKSAGLALSPCYGGVRRGGQWRRGSESNRRRRLCRPLHDHSATPPGMDAAGAGIDCTVATGQTKRESRDFELQALPGKTGAGNESRTRDLNLGKVALYQLSYSRRGFALYHRSASSQGVRVARGITTGPLRSRRRRSRRSSC